MSIRLALSAACELDCTIHADHPTNPPASPPLSRPRTASVAPRREPDYADRTLF